MMCRLSAAVGIAVLLVAGGLYAADRAPASPDDLKKVCGEALTQISRGEPQGYDVIKKHMLSTFWESSGQKWEDAVKTTSDQVRWYNDTFGAFLGLELVEETKVGNSLRKYAYVANYEKAPTRWEVVVYRPREEWKILAWKVSDDLDFLFKK